MERYKILNTHINLGLHSSAVVKWGLGGGYCWAYRGVTLHLIPPLQNPLTDIGTVIQG